MVLCPEFSDFEINGISVVPDCDIIGEITISDSDNRSLVVPVSGDELVISIDNISSGLVAHYNGNTSKIRDGKASFQVTDEGLQFVRLCRDEECVSKAIFIMMSNIVASKESKQVEKVPNTRLESDDATDLPSSSITAKPATNVSASIKYLISRSEVKDILNLILRLLREKSITSSTHPLRQEYNDLVSRANSRRFSIIERDKFLDDATTLRIQIEDNNDKTPVIKQPIIESTEKEKEPESRPILNPSEDSKEKDLRKYAPALATKSDCGSAVFKSGNHQLVVSTKSLIKLLSMKIEADQLDGSAQLAITDASGAVVFNKKTRVLDGMTEIGLSDCENLQANVKYTITLKGDFKLKTFDSCLDNMGDSNLSIQTSSFYELNYKY